MNPVKALLLDLDDTLLDGSGVAESIAGTCGRLAASRPELLAARLVQANAEAWRSYWPEVEHQWAIGLLDGAAVSCEAWRRTLLLCGCDDPSLVQLAVQTHMQLA